MDAIFKAAKTVFFEKILSVFLHERNNLVIFELPDLFR